MTRCAFCKASKFRRVTKTSTYEFETTRVSVAVPALQCEACSERYVLADDLGEAEHAVALALVRAGVRSPRAFRFIRKAAGLKAVEVADLLDVKPETVSRWENAANEVPRTAQLAINALLLDPDGARRALEALGKPPATELVAAL